MGGQGSGGARVGAGRKKKALTQKILHGTATRAEQAARQSPPAALPVVDPPATLTPEARAVWDELAPHAIGERTLTTGTAAGFVELCQAIVRARRMATRIEQDGDVVDTPLGPKAHPLITHLRGMMQRIEAGKLRYRLLPMGKPVVEPEKPTDDFEDFDAPVN